MECGRDGMSVTVTNVWTLVIDSPDYVIEISFLLKCHTNEQNVPSARRSKLRGKATVVSTSALTRVWNSAFVELRIKHLPRPHETSMRRRSQNLSHAS